VVLSKTKAGCGQDGSQAIDTGQENLRVGALNRQTQFLRDGESQVWFILLGDGEVEVADDDRAAGKVTRSLLEKWDDCAEAYVILSWKNT
jgi:hypothetical protein